MDNNNRSCSTGGCGSKGLCPGVAMFVAYLVGFGLTGLTGSTLLGFAVGVPLFVLLVLGLPHLQGSEVQPVRVKGGLRD